MPQPNINKMLKQVQQMQADMMKAQEQLKDEEVEASAGGGMVTVKMSGDREVKEVRIDAAALGDDISAEDLEMLQDTLVAAINEASRSAEELASRKLGGLTGGLGGLGDLGLPGL
jgi:DNA-binding YbaB/EbfC family protein